MTLEETSAQIEADFATLGCSVGLHVRCLSSGALFGLNADRPMIMASIFKPFVALELFALAAQGRLDLSERLRSDPATRVPGPSGLSNFMDEAELSLRDLARLMVTISDNEATDLLLARIGLDAVTERLRAMDCRDTHLRSNIDDMLNAFGAELGFADYRALLAAQDGRAGPDARQHSTDQARIDDCSALDPAQGSVTTARDMTEALAAIWRDEAASPEVCAQVRSLMAMQVTRRLEAATPAGGNVAAKSGGLFGRVRNEIAVIRYPDAKAYAVAILTSTKAGFGSTAAINSAMALAVDQAISTLRL